MTIWHWIFYLGVYSAVVACLYAIYRIHLDQGWHAALRQLLIFLAFGGLFYLLESWAHLRAPYYFYPPPLLVAIPVFDWTSVSWFPGPAPNPCVSAAPASAYMPLAVPLQEAALTFGVLWTATLLRARPWLQPFLGGIVFLGIDAFLDPVLAETFDCMAATTPTLSHAGLGLWEWHVHDALGTAWFGIPLFNYAAWFAAPVVLIALVHLFDWIGALLSSTTVPAITSFEAVFLAIVGIGFLIVFGMAPSAPWPASMQGGFLALVVVGTLVAVLWFAGGYDHGNAYRWWFIHPMLISVAVPLLVFLGSGLVISLPYLTIVGAITIPLVLVFAISPYWSAP